MNEADLKRHLAYQTNLKVGIITLAEIKAGQTIDAVRKCLIDGARILAIDVMDDETLAEAGRLIWPTGSGSCFAVGSQGVEYALVAHGGKLERLRNTKQLQRSHQLTKYLQFRVHVRLPPKIKSQRQKPMVFK